MSFNILQKIKASNVKPLFVLFTAFGIPPPFQHLSPQTVTFLQMYSAFVIIAVSAGEILLFWIRFHLFTNSYHVSFFVLFVSDVAEVPVLTALNLSYLFCIAFAKVSIRNELQTTISDTERELNWPTEKKTRTIELFFTFIVSPICMFTWTLISGFTTDKYFFFRRLQIFIGIMGVYQIYHINLHLQYLFKTVNVLLKHSSITESIGYQSLGFQQGTKSSSGVQRTSDLVKLYVKLCDCMDMINEIYGYPMLILITYLAVRIIGMLEGTLLLYKRLDTIPLITSLMWTAMIVIIGATMVGSCVSVSDEAHHTIAIAYNKLLSLPICFTKTIEKYEQDQLNLLIQIAMHRKPHISAAGFFTLDFAILLTTINSITPYNIMLMTMNQSL